jgi:hypothetical protein
LLSVVNHSLVMNSHPTTKFIIRRFSLLFYVIDIRLKPVKDSAIDSTPPHVSLSYKIPYKTYKG